MNNDIKEPTMGIKIAILLKFWFLVGMSRRENLCTQDTVWVNTMLNQIGTKAIFYLIMKVLAWYVDPNRSKTYPYPTDIQKNVK